MAAKAAAGSRDVTAELAYLTRALKAPTLREAIGRLANVPAPKPGATRSSSRPVCNARCPPENHMAVKAGFELPGFRRGSLWRSSTSTTPEVSNATPSPILGPWTSSPPRTTWCSSDHQEPGKPIWQSGLRSAPARPATASCSLPPANGSTAWPPPITVAPCKPSSSAWPVTAAGRRRSGLHPVRTRSRQPILPTGVLALRTGQPHRHLQQALRPLG
jgi:hypothetical protein